MTVEPPPANEARLEAFKALVAPQPIMSGEPTYFYTVGYAERATAFVADLLGELAAAQRSDRVAILSKRLGVERGKWSAMVEREKARAEAAEREVARLKAMLTELRNSPPVKWLSGGGDWTLGGPPASPFDQTLKRIDDALKARHAD